MHRDHVVKIISGGQIGADQGGLLAGQALGIPTGGWVPKGCKTQAGPNPDLVKVFGCQEHASDRYPPRTYANVKDSDGTMRFAINFNSPGEMCTLKAIIEYEKPYFHVDFRKTPPVEAAREWLRENKIAVLNVAGNSERTLKGMQRFAYNYLMRVLECVPKETAETRGPQPETTTSCS